MLSNTTLNQVKAVFNKLGQKDEFEIMFNNYKSDNKLSIIKFMDALKYLKWRSEQDKIELDKHVKRQTPAGRSNIHTLAGGAGGGGVVRGGERAK